MHTYRGRLSPSGTASATVTAQEFSQIWAATRDDLNAFLEAYPAPAGRLLVGMVSEMSKRIRNMNQKLASEVSEKGSSV